MPAHLEPHHRLRYENHILRVLEVKLRPDESSLFHTHSHDDVYLTLADAVARAQIEGGNCHCESGCLVGSFAGGWRDLYAKWLRQTS